MDFISDDSDGDEEEFELKEIDGRLWGKWKLFYDEIEGDRKWLWEIVNLFYM